MRLWKALSQALALAIGPFFLVFLDFFAITQ